MIDPHDHEQAVAKADYCVRNSETLRKRAADWRKNNSGKPSPVRSKRAMRASNLMSKYGITEAAYDRMLKQQNGVCFLCERTQLGSKPLYVDHCHATGKVRGLLCGGCNMAVGFIEKPGWLAKTMAYLGK